MTVAQMGMAYMVSQRARANREAELNTCDDIDIDEEKEEKKFHKYEELLSNSEVANKYLKLHRTKKFIYWGLKILFSLTWILSIVLGVTLKIDSMVPVFISTLIFSLIWWWPAVTATQNKIYFRVYKQKLIFVYATTFKKMIFYDDKFIKKSGGGFDQITINKLKIRIHNGMYTYQIRIGNEKPVTKQFGQYY